MTGSTWHSSKVARKHRAAPLLACAALAAALQAHAQADPACYVVNQVLRWRQPDAALIECARAREKAAPRTASAARTPATVVADRQAPPKPVLVAPLHPHPTMRRQP